MQKTIPRRRRRQRLANVSLLCRVPVITNTFATAAVRRLAFDRIHPRVGADGLWLLLKPAAAAPYSLFYNGHLNFRTELSFLHAYIEAQLGQTFYAK